MPTANKAWSYSALSLYETCPKQFYHLRVARDVQASRSENQTYGDEVHEAIAKYVKEGTSFPMHLTHLEKFIAPLRETAQKALASGAEMLVEQKLAVNAQLEPTGWFDPDVFCRAIVDFALVGDKVAHIIDFKTGKPHDDDTQLKLMACVFHSHKPSLTSITGAFWWTKTKTRTSYLYDCGNIAEFWGNLLHRSEPVYSGSTSKNNYKAKPSGLCKRHCPVKQCEYNGI